MMQDGACAEVECFIMCILVNSTEH